MRIADGLGPDLRLAEREEAGRGQDARLDVGPDAHHGPVELVHGELAQHFLLGGVRPHHVGQAPVVGLHDLFVRVDAEHFGALRLKLQRQGAAETSQADDDDGVRQRRQVTAAGEHVLNQ
ncbi:hypothetical protein FQZ97_1247270 [compost metagenome]